MAAAAADGAGPSSSRALVPVESAAGDVDLSVHPSGIVPQLQNVVATVDLGCKLDLKEIALQARNAEYNPKRFAAVIMRIREPKTTALIFASGKMVCTGAKSEQDSKLAAKKYCRIVQRTGFPEVKMKEFKIQNIVGSCDVKFPIRLEGLCMAHGYFATYEPELFPGLIYRMKDPKIVLLIFVSGKVVLTGAKKREEIYTAFENIYPTLKEYKKRDATDAAGLGALAAKPSQEAPKGLPAPGGSNGAAGAAGAAAGGAGSSGQQGGGSGAAAAGNGLDGQGSMLPPPDRRGGMRAPAAAAAAAAGGMLQPAPSSGHMPPPTPHHAPPATPAYNMPPATPGFNNMPPATPGYIMPSAPSFPAPGLPPAGMVPPLPRQQ